MAITKVTTPVTDFDKSTSLPGLKLPSGDNSNQPTGAAAEQGMIRNDTEETVNSSASALAHYNGTNWQYFAATESPDNPLPASLKISLDAGDTDSYPGTGTTWFDLTTNYNNGDINGAAWQPAGYFAFDGIDDWVNTNYTPPAGNSDFSIGCWFNSTYTTTAKGVWSTFTNAGNDRLGIHLDVFQGKARVIAYESTPPEVGVLVGTDTLITNGWHLCVVTYNGGFIRLYVDGVLQTETINKVITSHFGTVGLGLYYRSLTSNSNWDGDISKFYTYESILTQAEITALYNEGF